MRAPQAPGSTKAVKYGFYSNALQPEELTLWERVEIGTVGDEIKLVKIKLHPPAKLSGSSEVADLIDAAFDVALKHDTHPKLGGFDKREIKVRAARYGELICQALDQIRKLELAHKELNKIGDDPPPGEDGPVTRIVAEVVGANASHDHDGATG